MKYYARRIEHQDLNINGVNFTGGIEVKIEQKSDRKQSSNTINRLKKVQINYGNGLITKLHTIIEQNRIKSNGRQERIKNFQRKLGGKQTESRELDI